MNNDKRNNMMNLHSGRLSVVLDTDTFNEIDDQFALTYALLNPQRIDLKAVIAAPYHHERCVNPAIGMQNSYDEILKIYRLMNIESDGRVFKGADKFLKSSDSPVKSEGVDRIIELAMKQSEHPLVVVGIAAATNIASAILQCPDLAERIVVIWLGGHSYHWPTAEEFNLKQDIPAAQILFDSGVPLIHVPCKNVAQLLESTEAELAGHIKGRSGIGDYLYQIFVEYCQLKNTTAKVIWDIATIAYLINNEWVLNEIVSAPILTDDMKWQLKRDSHMIKTATTIDRNAIFNDFYEKMNVTYNSES